MLPQGGCGRWGGDHHPLHLRLHRPAHYSHRTGRSTWKHKKIPTALFDDQQVLQFINLVTKEKVQAVNLAARKLYDVAAAKVSTFAIKCFSAAQQLLDTLLAAQVVTRL